ncbi:unnamed protein product [Linum tenue]|uniref:Uncharacterized protein n=1 Tax=Linum tenue TaxID=586396 RepID=A0AAV0RAA6_9ROSI|nr:unnamed protein product [Linum tenue]
MVLCDFKSDKHFVASSDKTTLQIYELTNPTIHPSSIRKIHWRQIACITVRDDDDAESYDGLLFFDGHGKIEGREALTKLAQYLTRLRLMVSPEGYCFQDVTGLGEHNDFGIQYLRLNDLFNWPRHGVDAARSSVWHRLELRYVMPKYKKSPKQTTGVGVSKEKYEELKTMLRVKNEELAKVREEMDEELQNLRDEQAEELQKLKEETEEASETKYEEIKKAMKEKDEEFRKLLKKKDGELQMLKKGKNDGAMLQKLRKEKDEEFRKFKEKTDEEIEKIKREKDEEMEGLQKKEEEALQKLNEKDEELRKLTRVKDEELRKLLKKKDGELQMLRKGRNDGVLLQALRKEKDEELHKLKQEMEEEIEKLRNEKEEEAERIILEKEEETSEKLKEKDEQLQEQKKENGELQKLLQKKDGGLKDENRVILQKLRKEKDEQLRKFNEEMKKLRHEKDEEVERLEREKEEKEHELVALRQQGRSDQDGGESTTTTESLKKELEKCRKNSWGSPPISKILLHLPKEKLLEIHLSRRRPVPPQRFRRKNNSAAAAAPPPVPQHYTPDIAEGSHHVLFDSLLLIDEDVTAGPTPSPVTVATRDGQFDVNNWWFAKTTAPEGGTTMVAYYDGDFNRVSVSRMVAKDPIPLPYSKDANFCPNRSFTLVSLVVGLRLGFFYRS